MKKIIFIISVLSLIVAFTGCADNTAPKKLDKDYYIFVSGLLRAGKPIIESPIFVGKTVDPSNASIEGLAIEEDVEVTITDEARNTLVELTAADSLPVYFDPTFSFIPEANKTYYIYVKIGTIINPDSTVTYRDTVWAKTTVPHPVEVSYAEGAYSPDTLEWAQIRYKDITKTDSLKIYTVSDSALYLRTIYYALSDDWKNAKYTEDYWPSDSPEEEDDYDDPGNDHHPRKENYFYTYVPTMEPGDEKYSVSISGYKNGFVFFGKYSFEIFAIDRNYYTYLYKSHDNYKYGGINNGYGYFGSANGVKLYTEILEDSN